MKLSIIDTLCPRSSLENKLHFLEGLGIEGIELETALQNDVRRGAHTVLNVLSTSKVKVSTVLAGYKGDLLASDSNVRKMVVERIKLCLEACAELNGIGVVTVPSHFGTHKLLNLFFNRKKESRKALVAEAYKILGKYAQDLGVYVLIEPMDRFRTNFVNTCREAVELCEMTRSDMVKICPDLFHMSIEEPNINDKIKEFSDYIVHIHIGDNDSKSKYAKLPGYGNLDFKSMTGVLAEIDYSGYLSFDCEIPSEEELRSSVRFLRSRENSDSTNKAVG